MLRSITHMRGPSPAKRKLCLFAACLVLAAGLFIWLWPTEPYRFLSGHTPVQVNDKTWPTGRIIDRSYAFRADYDDLIRRVAQELARHGLALVTDDRSFGPRAIRYESKPGATNSGHKGHVIVFQDMHYMLPQNGEPYGIVGYDDPGWASVQVHLELPLSKLDAFLFKLRD
jgi:hypothetical protein